MNTAVILSGGIGSRMRSSQIPKQFIKLKNREILYYTIKQFDNCDLIHNIIIVSNSDWVSYTENMISEYQFNKPICIILGGKTRPESTFNALNHIKNNNSEYDDIILIHDGVRPFISQSVIEKGIHECKTYKACCVAVKTTDTIVECDGKEIKKILKRDVLYNEQTPQIFQFGLIWEAYNNNKNLFDTASDDITFATADGNSVFIVEGDYNNIKITTDEDINKALSILNDF